MLTLPSEALDRYPSAPLSIAGVSTNSSSMPGSPFFRNSGVPWIRMSVGVPNWICSSWLRVRVPPTVVAKIPRPVTSTRRSTSHVYCSGFRAMCHRLMESHAGAERITSESSWYSTWAGTIARSPTSATKSVLDG